MKDGTSWMKNPAESMKNMMVTDATVIALFISMNAAPILRPRPWEATMVKKIVSKVRENAAKLGFIPTIKYTMSMKRIGKMRSKGRSVIFRAAKYALSLYIPADLSFINITLSCGKVKIAVKQGKNPQKTEMKNSNPA